MANQYDTNLKLQAIADAIGDTQSSGLISALEDIADAVAGGGGGGSSTAGLVSDNFSETDTYDMGEYCIHNNTLYVCINAITTPGTWDLSDWQATNAGIELSSLNSAITHIEDIVETYTFPKNQSEVSGGNNSYTVQHNGAAIITYKFASQAYSQFGLSVNGKSITPGNISSGSVTLGGLTGVITLPVFKDDVISVSFYQTYGMDLISLRLGAKV